jgi:tRNA(Arg) A34 adenosine deaminase TadA
MTDEEHFLYEAIAVAHSNVEKGGRPFGAVIVKDGKIIATGVNEILATKDPTAHAELNAIRAASRKLDTANLKDCSVYASGHPCPMCLAAMYMAGIRAVVYAYSNDDGAPYGLSTVSIYTELKKPLAEQSLQIRHVPIREDRVPSLYAHWKSSQTKAT